MTTTDTGPQTLDTLWDELLFDACASDGPIRDNDVRQAVKHYRARIETEARRLTVEPLRAFLDTPYPNNGEGRADRLVWYVPESAFGPLRALLAQEETRA